ncbi:MAG TPA: hypothetical protein VF844_09330 [Ktedonobacteraceae bacterium]
MTGQGLPAALCPGESVPPDVILLLPWCHPERSEGSCSGRKSIHRLTKRYGMSC